MTSPLYLEPPISWSSGDPQALMERGYIGLIRPDDREAYIAAIAMAAKTGEPASAEFRLAETSGKGGTKHAHKWIELSCRPIVNKAVSEGPMQLVAVFARHHPSQETARRAAPGPRSCRAGEFGKNRIPCQYEP